MTMTNAFKVYRREVNTDNVQPPFSIFNLTVEDSV